MDALAGYAFIFCAKLIELSLYTFRMLMLTKGKRVPAAIIGFFEISIWITALSRVMSSFDDIGNVLAYAGGFATGNFLGSYLEEKIAVGILSAEVILDEKSGYLVDIIRDAGFGVTVVEGKGMDSNKLLLHIVLKRKELKKLNKLIQEYIESPVISVTDTRAFYGGFLRNIKR